MTGAARLLTSRLVPTLQCACSTFWLPCTRLEGQEHAGEDMSASQEQRAEWLDPEFWERLDRLESRHQKIQSDHESARRGLDRVTPREADELRNAWRSS